MLFNLALPFAESHALANLLRYLTFRSAAACMTAMVLSLMFGPALIRLLKSVQRQGQPIRPDGPESHLITKVGTPTMGGVLILSTMTVSTLLWADLRNEFVWAALAIGVVGMLTMVGWSLFAMIRAERRRADLREPRP